jgi:hypothetical protein
MAALAQAMAMALLLVPKRLSQETTPKLEWIFPAFQADGTTNPQPIIILP